jgi:hypothetical protein
MESLLPEQLEKGERMESQKNFKFKSLFEALGKTNKIESIRNID